MNYKKYALIALCLFVSNASINSAADLPIEERIKAMEQKYKYKLHIQPLTNERRVNSVAGHVKRNAPANPFEGLRQEEIQAMPLEDKLSRLEKYDPQNWWE